MKKLLTFLTLLTLFFTTAWAATVTKTITFNSTFTPALSTSSHSNVITHTVEGLSIAEVDVYKASSYSYMMFKQNSGFLYNLDNLGTIKSVSVTYTNGTSNTGQVGVYFGNSVQSTRNTSSNNLINQGGTQTWTNSTTGYGYFQVSSSIKNVQITKIAITYDDSGSSTGLNDPSISFSGLTAGGTTVTATINPDENASATYYRIGETGDYTEYSTPVDIDLTENASPIKVYAYSTDGTNTTDPVYQEFTVPALGLSISPASYDGYAAQPVTITPSNYVGDYAITYTINGGNDIDYSAPFTLSDPGTYEIVANVIDERKNAVEATKTSTITIREAQGIELPFIETFDDFAATQGGGNDNNFGAAGTVQINTNTDQADNEGWVYNAVYPALNCVKIGKSDGGSATTPTIKGLTVGNTYTLTFKAAPWGNDGTTLNLSATGATLSESSVTMETGTWKEFTITLTATATSTTIMFTPAKRCFLDEVNVKEPVIADGYYLYGTFNGWNTKDDHYKFTEDNGNYVLNNVDLPANVRFKISKVENGQVTEYGGSGDSDYGIHRDWHTHIDMKGVQAYTIAGAALTNFILHPNADINNMYFEVERVPQLYFKCDKINNWANNPMSQVNGVWTYSGELEAGAKFGFN